MRTGQWARPPRLFKKERLRWLIFCATVEQRIQHARAMEGIDGRVTSWQAFDPPLPSSQPLPFSPVRLRLMAAPTLARDPRTGRLLARTGKAS